MTADYAGEGETLSCPHPRTQSTHPHFPPAVQHRVYLLWRVLRFALALVDWCRSSHDTTNMQCAFQSVCNSLHQQYTYSSDANGAQDCIVKSVAYTAQSLFIRESTIMFNGSYLLTVPRSTSSSSANIHGMAPEVGQRWLCSIAGWGCHLHGIAGMPLSITKHKVMGYCITTLYSSNLLFWLHDVKNLEAYHGCYG